MEARKIRVYNADGTLLKLCESVASAALFVGISQPSVRRLIKESRSFQGMWMVYDDPKDAETGMSMVRGRNLQKILDVEGVGYESEFATGADAEKVEQLFTKKHITLERIPYEVKYGRVSTTICRKKDKVQPKVGSVVCEQCWYFYGRCKSERFVLCAYRSYNGPERKLHEPRWPSKSK
jgi:hypothetical protein